MSSTAKDGTIRGTPWYASRFSRPNTTRSPESSTRSVYGRPRFSVLPMRNTHAAPRLSDTTGSSAASSRSWCMPMRESAP